MVNKLSATKQRISYAEELEIAEALRKIAKERGVELTVVMKEAAAQYIESIAASAPVPKSSKKEDQK